MQNTKIPSGLEARILRFEGEYAVLLNGNGTGEFKWALTQLPKEYKIGDTVTLSIINPKTEEATKLEAMRKLLEELIN